MLNNRLLFFIALSFTFITVHGQSVVTNLLDSVLIRAQQTSMYSSSIDWETLRTQVFAQAKDAKDIEDLNPAFSQLINGMLDKHAKIISAETYAMLGSFSAFDQLSSEDDRPRDLETWQAVNDTSKHFHYELLPNNIAYLKIVGIAPNVNILVEAKKIRNAVIELAAKQVDHWIVDLRYNGGGNMQPMVNGIAPLIGDGLVGHLSNLSGEYLFDWRIKESNFIYRGATAVELPNQPKFETPPKVAVLTSKYTVSSGELVAVCFKGRANTRFFGEATGGYTTNNNWEVIDNKVILTLSTGIFCDKNNQAYPINIPVDQEVTFEVTDDYKKDEGIRIASDWLMKK